MQNLQIRDNAAAYNEIVSYIKNNSHSGKPISMEDIYTGCPGAKNPQQCIDVVRKYRALGNISTYKEGRTLALWWNESAVTPLKLIPKSEGIPKVEITPVKIAPAIDNKPEIIVTKSKVVVISASVKITIEL